MLPDNKARLLMRRGAEYSAEMGVIWGELVEAVAGLHPRVRRRRETYREMAAVIEDQDVPARSFRCDSCSRVQSRHAASALVAGSDGQDATPGVWCVTCVEKTGRDRNRARTVVGVEP